MPSIPQSLLWISLVVLWLFVLVPMLISRRDAVRRTSDVALATRVLNNRDQPAGCSSVRDRPPGTAAIRTGDRPKTTSSLGGLRRRPLAPQRSVVVAASRRRRHRTPLPRRRRHRGALGCIAGWRVGRRGGRRRRRRRQGNRQGGADTGSRGARGERRHCGSTKSRPMSTKTDRPALPTGTSMSTTPWAWRLRRTSDLQVAESLMAARRRRYDPTKAEAVERPQVQVPQADAGVDDVDPGRVGDGGLPGDARGMVGLRWLRRSDADVPGLSAPSDADRGTGAPAPHAAARAFAARGGEHRQPRFRPGPVAAAADRERWCWRSTTRTRKFEHLDYAPSDP